MSHMLAGSSEVKRLDSSEDNEPCICVNNVDTETDNVHPHSLDILIQHYSSYYRLKKAICWLLRVKYCFKVDKLARNTPITVAEMRDAEVVIIKYVQGCAYEDELTILKQGKHVAKSSRLFKLAPALKDGLLVVGGRLKHAAINEDMKNHLILPHDHRISHLIVQEYHGAANLGTESTLSQVRQRYWVTQAMNIIKMTKRSCVTCKKLYGVGLN